MTAPTLTTHTAESQTSRAGAIGALVAAATFIFGIALFVTTLSDYTEGDPTPAESVEFLTQNQSTLFAWYFVIFLVFGVAIIPLARALHRRLADVTPQLADIGAVFAYIWAGLMFATGMISNIGITAVADLEETDPAASEHLWSAIDAVTDGLGGGNELVGGMWILLVSIAAWASRRLPTRTQRRRCHEWGRRARDCCPRVGPMSAWSSGSARSCGSPGPGSSCSAPPTGTLDHLLRVTVAVGVVGRACVAFLIDTMAYAALADTFHVVMPSA